MKGQDVATLLITKEDLETVVMEIEETVDLVAVDLAVDLAVVAVEVMAVVAVDQEVAVVTIINH